MPVDIFVWCLKDVGLGFNYLYKKEERDIEYYIIYCNVKC